MKVFVPYECSEFKITALEPGMGFKIVVSQFVL